MNRVLAIAGLTLRTAVRSRVLALLVVLIVGGILGLPLILKSDGTLAGQVQLFLNYTLGLTMILLSVMAMWAGAGAVSLEVEGRQMQLVVVKPVHALEVWLGKWLGLMAVNMILLILAGAMIYGLLRWTTRSTLLSAADHARLREDILVARSDILPEPPSAGRPAEGGRVTVAPGAAGRWQFRVPARIATPARKAALNAAGGRSVAGGPARLRVGHPLYLQFRFVSAQPGSVSPMAGLWRIGDDREPDGYRHPVSCLPNQPYSFKIPLPTPGRLLTVVYENREAQEPATVLFDSLDSVKLLVHESGFEVNYIRALLMVLAHLAFFSALGLTAGVLFSFPVAVFVSMALLLVAGFNRWIQQAAAGGMMDYARPDAGRVMRGFNEIVLGMFVALNWIMPPLFRLEPLDFLPGGILISWGLVGKAWLVLGVIYSGILAVLGAWLFSRREIGLPPT